MTTPDPSHRPAPRTRAEVDSLWERRALWIVLVVFGAGLGFLFLDGQTGPPLTATATIEKHHVKPAVRGGAVTNTIVTVVEGPYAGQRVTLNGRWGDVGDTVALDATVGRWSGALYGHDIRRSSAPP